MSRSTRKDVRNLRNSYGLSDIEALDVLEIMDNAGLPADEAVMHYRFCEKKLLTEGENVVPTVSGVDSMVVYDNSPEGNSESFGMHVIGVRAGDSSLAKSLSEGKYRSIASA